MVKPSGGDDTALIQGALDRIAAMPVNADGFRGALRQQRRFHLKGQLHLRTVASFCVAWEQAHLHTGCRRRYWA